MTTVAFYPVMMHSFAFPFTQPLHSVTHTCRFHSIHTCNFLYIHTCNFLSILMILYTGYSALEIEKKKKKENCTILISKGNSYCRRKSSVRGRRFKVSSEGLSAELTYRHGHPSKYKPRPMLLNSSVLGGLPYWYANSH